MPTTTTNYAIPKYEATDKPDLAKVQKTDSGLLFISTGA